MAEFFPLWDGGPLFAQAEHFKLGTDSILLADFVRSASAKRGIDLGCASGIIPLILLEKNAKLTMCGLEINSAAAELASENMEKNGYAPRCEIICGDIRKHRSLFRTGSFEFVTANPPYFPVSCGYLSPDSERAAARGEVQCTLRDICAAAAFLLKTGGIFYIVHRSERLSELMCTMSEYGIEPKRLRLIQHKSSAAPILVLVEGRRGGKTGLIIEPNLILYDGSGGETDEYKRIYHR